MRIFLEISELQHFMCRTDYLYVITELDTPLNSYIQFVHDCMQFAWTVNCSIIVAKCFVDRSQKLKMN